MESKLEVVIDGVKLGAEVKTGIICGKGKPFVQSHVGDITLGLSRACAIEFGNMLIAAGKEIPVSASEPDVEETIKISQPNTRIELCQEDALAFINSLERPIKLSERFLQAAKKHRAEVDSNVDSVVFGYDLESGKYVEFGAIKEKLFEQLNPNNEPRLMYYSKEYNGHPLFDSMQVANRYLIALKEKEYALAQFNDRSKVYSYLCDVMCGVKERCLENAKIKLRVSINGSNIKVTVDELKKMINNAEINKQRARLIRHKCINNVNKIKLRGISVLCR